MYVHLIRRNKPIFFLRFATDSADISVIKDRNRSAFLPFRVTQSCYAVISAESLEEQIAKWNEALSSPTGEAILNENVEPRSIVNDLVRKKILNVVDQDQIYAKVYQALSIFRQCDFEIRTAVSMHGFARFLGKKSLEEL